MFSIISRLSFVLLVILVFSNFSNAENNSRKQRLKSIYGCYEFSYDLPESAWRQPPKQLKLFKGKPPKDYKCDFFQPSPDQLLAQAVSRERFTSCLFEFSSWQLTDDNEIILVWSTGESGVKVRLKQSGKLLRGALSFLKDTESPLDTVIMEYPVLGVRMRCPEDK